MANIARQLKYFQSKRSPRARKPLCNANLRIYLSFSYSQCAASAQQASRPTLTSRPRPGRPGIGKRSAAEFDAAKIADLGVDSTEIADLEGEEAKIADLEGEYLFNPTHETALSLLEARPWKGKSLVSSISFLFKICCITGKWEREN